MRITVKTTGLLADHLPPGASGDSAVLEVPEGATPQDVMTELGMPLDESYLVVVNDELVPKAERARRALEADDELTIMPPLRGG
ncbi:MAG: MoaD/ThiS family protein [Alphaproteobacteria bacterium]